MDQDDGASTHCWVGETGSLKVVKDWGVAIDAQWLDADARKLSYKMWGRLSRECWRGEVSTRGCFGACC